VSKKTVTLYWVVAKEYGYHPQIIDGGRFVNDSMGRYLAKQTVKQIIAKDKNIKNAKILVMGITFKEDVTDIRNSKVVDVIDELKSFAVNVDVVDAFADKDEIKKEYNLEMIDKPQGKYDAVVVAVNHKPYMELTEDYFKSLMNEDGVLVDVKGIYREKIKNLQYLSL